MASVKCPECGERVKVHRDRTRLRCPECGELFSPPDEDDEGHEERERPRRRLDRRRGAPKSSGTKVALIVAGSVLLVVVLGAVIVLATGRGDRIFHRGDPSKVTAENFKKLQPWMTPEEVESILGPGREVSEREAWEALRPFDDGDDGIVGGILGRKGVTWRHWVGRDVHVWVAFGPIKDRPQVAQVGTLLEVRPDGSFKWAGRFYHYSV